MHFYPNSRKDCIGVDAVRPSSGYSYLSYGYVSDGVRACCVGGVYQWYPMDKAYNIYLNGVDWFLQGCE